MPEIDDVIGRNIEDYIKREMKGHGLHTKKRLGQNFLIDPDVIRDIIAASEIGPDDLVLEIGPGPGIMTEELAKRAGRVVAVELDSDLIPMLRKRLGHYGNLALVNGDILEIDLTKALYSDITVIREKTDGRRKAKVVANLPYYITSPVILRILENYRLFSSVTVMVQREVAERITASPGSKDYGAFTVAVQFRSMPRHVRDVPPSAFLPAPKVYSSVVRLDILDKPLVEVKDEELFFKVVRACFSQRRKTLRNNLKSIHYIAGREDLLDSIFEESGIDPGRRAETLSLEEFGRLADLLGAKAGLF